MKTRVEFRPPNSFAMPEGITPNEEFDCVCSFRRRNNGQVCMTKMGDAAMPGYDEKESSKPSYSEYSKPMRDAAMPQGEA